MKLSTTKSFFSKSWCKVILLFIKTLKNMLHKREEIVQCNISFQLCIIFLS